MFERNFYIDNLISLFRPLFSSRLFVVFSLLLNSLKFILSLQIHFSVEVFGQNFNKRRQLLFQLGHSIVTQFLRPVLLVLPEARGVELGQTFRLYVTITSHAVESFPVFPSRLVNEMFWV